MLLCEHTTIIRNRKLYSVQVIKILYHNHIRNFRNYNKFAPANKERRLGCTVKPVHLFSGNRAAGTVALLFFCF